MTDTPEAVQRLYSEFIMAKPVTERFQMGFSMNNEGKRMIEYAVARQQPYWSAAELKAAVFERMYRDDFSAEEMARIKTTFLESHNRK